MLDAIDTIDTALRTAAARLSSLGIHGKLSVRRVQNAETGRTVGVVTVRLDAHTTGADERTATAEIHRAADAIGAPLSVLAA